MLQKKSHLRARNTLAVFLVAVLPVSAALAGSFFIAKQAIQSGQSQIKRDQVEEVRAQSRLLAEALWSQIDDLKIRALYPNRGPGIKTVAQVQLAADGTPKSAPWIFDAAASRISIQDIRNTGSSVFRLGNDLGIAFFAPGNSSKLVLADVDPAQVFGVFSRWRSRREGGNLRGYIIGADGRVLVHSERAYSGSDFSSSALYQQALRALFKGDRVSGIATVEGIDFRPVLTSYARLSTLPFAVVVERVVQPSGFAVSTVLREVFVPAILLVAACLMMCIFGAILFHKFIEEPREVLQAETDILPALDRISQARDLRTLKRKLEDSFGETEEAPIAPQPSSPSIRSPEKDV